MPEIFYPEHSFHIVVEERYREHPLMRNIPWGEVRVWAHNRPTEKQGATVLARMSPELPCNRNKPVLVYWDYGEGRAMAYVHKWSAAPCAPGDIAGSVELEVPSLPLDQEDDWQMAREASAEIHQLETQLRNLEIERRFRRSELRPDVDLSVGYGRQGEDEAVGSAYRNLDNESYSLSLNYNLPWGKRAMKSRLAQVEDDLVACRASLEEANQKLRQEWEGLFREIESKRAQIVLNESSVGVAEENYRIQVERNRVGLASTLDVIQAQESLLEAQLSLLNAEVAYQHTYRQLLLMAGII